MLFDYALPELFCDKLRQAQAAVHPQLGDIKDQREATTGLPWRIAPPVFQLLYSIADNMVVVSEADGRRRIVVPEGPLRLEICKYFHEEERPSRCAQNHTCSDFLLFLAHYA